eukprot:XP_001706815.1 Hypothetical protein GL50803_39548 [Giardia lamblia ATCC 50803]
MLLHLGRLSPIVISWNECLLPTATERIPKNTQAGHIYLVLK